MIPASEITLLPASIEDYPIVQNLARFYVYDRSGYMGWPCSEDGMFDCIDFKHYFEHSDEKAFLIKVNDELAGFVLLDKEHLIEPVDWNMGEFFVIAKFQGKGIATEVIQKVFQEHPGKWSVAVMPENIKAAKFWKKVISDVSGGDYTEVFKTENELRTAENPDPYAMNILSFQIHNIFLNKSDLNGIQLIGERLTCETLGMEYAEDICKNFTAKITKYMLPSGPKTQIQINEHILGQQQAMRDGKELELMVLKKDTREFLGYISMHKLKSSNPEMGIWIKEEAHGQGYGFEALSLLKRWAEENLTFDCLTYAVDKSNFASRALAEKLGGQIEAEYLKESESGNILDEVEYRFYKPVLQFLVRPSIFSDINRLVFLSKEKRLAYEKAQPQFWRYAGESAEKSQSIWFTELISHKDYILLTAEDANQAILGFIIGRLMPAPEVYNPGGLTLMIDDFCVRSEHLWASVGDRLLKKIKQEAKEKGAAQILVVCGAHDKPKHRFLREQHLSIASEWFVGSVEF